VRVRVHFDGGGPNPGESACGAVVYDARGNHLASDGRRIGTATNNIAEYRGLLLGIELAETLGATDIEIRGDSQLVIRQMGGEWRTKSPVLASLRARAWDALLVFDTVELDWVPREENAAADAKVREALGSILKPSTAGTRRDWKGSGQRLAEIVHLYLLGGDGVDRRELRRALTEYERETA
jgi:ribonuclease HI